MIQFPESFNSTVHILHVCLSKYVSQCVVGTSDINYSEINVYSSIMSTSKLYRTLPFCVQFLFSKIDNTCLGLGGRHMIV